MGALEVSKVVHGHQAWRLISCIWLHAGVFHILANMLSLVFIGIRLEQEFGFGMHLIPSLNFVIIDDINLYGIYRLRPATHYLCNLCDLQN